MIKLKLLLILLGLLSSVCIKAADDTNYEDAELIKLRIKELELKKEILELEAKKEGESSHPISAPQSYVSPNTNSSYSKPSNANSYIRGPRGGCYTYSKSGNKRYVDRSLCN